MGIDVLLLEMNDTLNKLLDELKQIKQETKNGTKRVSDTTIGDIEKDSRKFRRTGSKPDEKQ